MRRDAVASYSMQVKKSDVKARILAAAQAEFASVGFAGASMRRIAAEAGVGVANVYNYFSGKDDIFCQVVGPAVCQMERILEEHHGADNHEDVMLLLDEGYLDRTVEQYVSLIHGYRDLLALLLFKAQGSSLENYREDFTNRSTVMVSQWFLSMKRSHPSVKADFPEILLHIQAAWLFSFIEEVVMHGVAGDELRGLVRSFVSFEVNGWASLVGISGKH